MNNTKENLDQVRKLILDPNFLKGEGLSNEVNIRIFCYDPKDEMTVRFFTKQLVEDNSLSCNLIECNMYETFLDICNDLGILEAIPEIEEREGSKYLLEQLNHAVTNVDFVKKIEGIAKSENDILIITGVGSAFPFMRVHSILEALQPVFPDLPILIMYPGKFNKHELKLFDKLRPNNYYRAFNII